MTAVFAFLVAVAFSNSLLAQQFPSPADMDRGRIWTPQPSSSPATSSLPTPVEMQPNQVGEQFLDKVEFSDTPLDQAVRLFSQESGLKVVASDIAKKIRVTASIRNMSATMALNELTRQSGTFYKFDRTSGVYTIYAASERDKSAWDSESLRRFEQEINEAFPDSIVRLSAVGKQLLVRGQAHDVVEASRIIQLIDAESKSKKINPDGEANRTTTEMTQNPGLLGGLSFLQMSEPDLTVIDMLTVTGEQQVSLRVTVAEVDRSAARQIGLNFNVNQGTSVFQSLIGASGGGNLPTVLDNGQIRLAINALRQMSLAKTLAEPTLTALNGQQASFQAGGQFPIPIVSGQTVGGLQGVTFVPFGVTLQFTPYITDRDRIRLNVSAEVSNRTQGTNAGDTATIGGAIVPGLNLRKFQTIVELRERQTLAVAGLISTNQVNQSDRVPFFGDLPVVGRLAALDKITTSERELVILVTPELVHPLNPEERPSLPGTDIFEPGDIEFYLGGHMEGTRNEDFRSPVRTDLHRQQRFYQHRDVYIVGPHGYTECGPQPGVFP